MKMNEENIPPYLKSTVEMIRGAFPKGVDRDAYFILLYILYEYMSDENLSKTVASLVDKEVYIVLNDIYKVHYMNLDQKQVKDVKDKLILHGLEKMEK